MGQTTKTRNLIESQAGNHPSSCPGQGIFPGDTSFMNTGTSPCPTPVRKPLPGRLCNLDRLVAAMSARGVDGIVASGANNVYYLTGFIATAHKSDEPRPYAVVLSRHAPEHPVLVLADYYLASIVAQPSWVEDIRPFRSVMLPMDVAPARSDIDRFIPRSAQGLAWIAGARERFSFDMASAVRGAIADLGLASSRIAFDDLGYGMQLKLESATPVDGYDVLMDARAIKTAIEVGMLERAAALNEAAILRTIAAWAPGCNWRDLGHAYAKAVIDLGGFVHDPGGMVWGHPTGTDAAIQLQTGLEMDEVRRGTNVMFDCHGIVDLYCWDGGKTWVVDGEPEGDAKLHADATAKVAETLIDAMRPGTRVSTLQRLARDTYRKCGLKDADQTIAFFHGLGLSHMDLPTRTADGKPNADWVLEAGMVVPLHLLVPGGERARWWLEEIVHIGPQRSRPLFSWGFGPN